MRPLFEEIQTFLPNWLTSEGKNRLYNDLGNFPDGIHGNFFSNYLLGSEIIYQGDLIDKQPVAFYPNYDVVKSRVIILSNTCDISVENERVLSPSVNFVPVIRLENYMDLHKKNGWSDEQIRGKCEDIRSQNVTNLFYMPPANSFSESVALFDQIVSIDVDKAFYYKLLDNRYAVLSQSAHYLFVLKLSMHFTRFSDQIER